MTVISFPKPDPKNIIWVCQCGNTTFQLKPGMIAVCAHCKNEIVSGTDEQIGAWMAEFEPPVPEKVPEEPLGHTVVDFNDNQHTLKNVTKWILEREGIGFIIGVDNTGEIKTYGSIGGEAQTEWFERRVERARSMLFDDYDGPLKASDEAARLADKEPTR
jgi:hypothetical protein